MKYIIYLLAAMYIIWWFYIIKFFMLPKEININEIKNKVVIIIPQNELISYKNNPKWLFKENEKSWIWTWFFINNKWHIQTVNHILENEDIKYKIIYNNKEYESNIISRNKQEDLAIIEIKNLEKNEKIKPLKIAEKTKLDEEIFSFWIDTKNLEIIFNTWTIINQKSKLENMSNLLEISNNLKPGFSWWPIINKNWEVIWINYAISQWKSYWIKFTEK